MKRFLMVVAMVLMASGLMADESDKKETMYRVEIRIVYNELNAKDAAKVLRDIMEEHESACKVEVESKKVVSDLYVTSGVSWSLIPSE